MDSKPFHTLTISSELSFSCKSTAAQATSFLLKELNILFDAGHDLGSMTTNIQLILVSHKDADHVKNICSHILNSNHKPTILCPSSMAVQLANFITSFFQLTTSSSRVNYSNHCTIYGMEENQTFIYEPSRSSKWLISAYSCFHGSTQCLAYGLTRITKGLKQEYLGMSSEEIVSLRKANTVITEERYTPVLFYATDTTIDVFGNKDLFKFPTILCECTLLETKHELGPKKHIHWDQLKILIKENTENNFILFHFSEQYKELDVVNFFQKVEIENARPYFCVS